MMFESESFITPYGSLDLSSKEKNTILRTIRNHKELQFSLNASLVEMLTLQSRIVKAKLKPEIK